MVGLIEVLANLATYDKTERPQGGQFGCSSKFSINYYMAGRPKGVKDIHVSNKNPL